MWSPETISGSLGTPFFKATRESNLFLFVSPFLACPEAEEPANLESFGGEDPRPEGCLSSPLPPHSTGAREWGDWYPLAQRSLCLQRSLSLPHLGSWGGSRSTAGDQALAALRPATAELLSSLEDLELSNRRLAGENAKLQHSVETAEEGSARLGEEIASLRKQLRR